MCSVTRAVDAIRFGITIRREGYNLFALGPSGIGEYSTVRASLDRQAAAEPRPPDWCYVHNFDRAHAPRVLRLEPGKGRQLREDMAQLVEDLRAAIIAAFDRLMPECWQGNRVRGARAVTGASLSW